MDSVISKYTTKLSIDYFYVLEATILTLHRHKYSASPIDLNIPMSSSVDRSKDEKNIAQICAQIHKLTKY